MQFYVDAMLGRFGKTLRLLGFDTLIASPELTDTEILNQCLEQNRYLITNDKLFHSRMNNKTNSNGSEAKSLLIDSTAQLPDQLSIFFKFFNIDFSFNDFNKPESFISRCTNCNGQLKEVSKDEIKDKVNNGTYEHQERFWICTSCHNVYWIGSHWNNIKNTLKKIDLSN